MRLAVARVLAVWTLLLAGGALGRALGGELGTLATFAAAAVLALATRRHRDAAASAPGAAWGAVAGFAICPVCVAIIGVVGLGIGLEAPPPAAPARGWAAFLASGLLAPLFEELVYREGLLLSLRASLPAVAALPLSSAVFALPHLGAWDVLGTFLVGLLLGGVVLATRNVWLCVGVHAGLNLRLLASGAPPAVEPLDLGASALVGGALLASAILLGRGTAVCSVSRIRPAVRR